MHIIVPGIHLIEQLSTGLIKYNFPHDLFPYSFQAVTRAVDIPVRQSLSAIYHKMQNYTQHVISLRMTNIHISIREVEMEEMENWNKN